MEYDISDAGKAVNKFLDSIANLLRKMSRKICIAADYLDGKGDLVAELAQEAEKLTKEEQKDFQRLVNKIKS